MSTATLARPGRRSLIGKLGSAFAARARGKGKSPKLAAALAAASQHAVTAAAMGALDVGLFHWGPGVGWIGVCVSLLALDFAVTG